MRQHNSIGVDVSDTSIKVLLLDIRDEVIAYGTSTLEKGVVENGNIVDKKTFAEALSSVLKNTEPLVLDRSRVNLRAIVSMPESKLFTHTVAIPSSIQKKDIDQFVKNAAETIIPYNFDDLYYDFYVRDAHESKTAVFVGVPKHELDAYVDAFSQAGVKPVFVGGELFSLGRALLAQDIRGKGCMILDMGAHRTTLGVYLEDAIASASIVIREGGESLTAALSESLGVSLEEAETLKRTHGVKDGDKDAAKVKEALVARLSIIAQAVKEARTHFQTKYAVPIDSLIVAGGSALLPGITEFLEAQTGIATKRADPAERLKNHIVFTKNTPSILFANVIGLALCGAKNDLPKINLLTQYRYVDSGEQKQLLKLQDIQSVSDAIYVLYSLFHIVEDRIKIASTFFTMRFKFNMALAGSLLLLASTLVFLAWVIIKYL